MKSVRSKFIDIPFDSRQYKIHYLEWGSEHSPVLICAHGLTRNAHDFDFLAQSLSNEFRVIALDYPGRGQSQWLDNKSGYTIANYVEFTIKFIEQLQLNTVNWLGTSMGGLIGMILTALHPEKIARLIINDVGPQIDPLAIKRIGEYLAMQVSFKSIDEFEKYIRQIYSPFGYLTDQHWQHLARYSHAKDENGSIIQNHDPQIIVPFQENNPANTDLWPIWQAINSPVFLIHGENSDILSASIFDRMKQLQPDLVSCEISKTGHAPALMDIEQIKIINNWLN